MPVLFQPYQSQLKDKNGKQLYYPRVVRTATVNTAQIAKDIAAYSSLSPGDVKNTIDNLITVMGQHLQSSVAVSLDGLGIFRMKMKSRGRGVEIADDVSASQSSLTVSFLPASTRNIDGSVATRSMVTGVKCVRYNRNESTDTNTDGNGEVPVDPDGVIDPTA